MWYSTWVSGTWAPSHTKSTRPILSPFPSSMFSMTHFRQEGSKMLHMSPLPAILHRAQQLERKGALMTFLKEKRQKQAHPRTSDYVTWVIRGKQVKIIRQSTRVNAKWHSRSERAPISAALKWSDTSTRMISVNVLRHWRWANRSMSVWMIFAIKWKPWLWKKRKSSRA